MIAVCGTVSPGFETIADIFAATFEGRPSMGAGLCVRLEGKTIIDLWARVADERSNRNWTADTPSVIFSCTKGLVSILVARLVQEGRLSYSDPVCRHWPEFAAAGKESITVGDALSHRAGLSAPRVDLTREDITNWERITGILAAQAPLWQAGEGYAYHALTHGWLAGEIIRRVTGMSVGSYFRHLAAIPLHAGAWIGLPASGAERPAHMQIASSLRQYWDDEAKKPGPNWPCRAMTLGGALPPQLITSEGGFNDPLLQAAEIPGAGGIASARALASLWSAAVVPTDGARLLDEVVVAEACTERSGGKPVFDAEPPYARWGAGFQLDSEARRYLGPQSFGHDGAGGQVGFADPGRRLGFAFVTNWMMGLEDRRATAIIDALRKLV